jgi:hypothetical protein
MLDNGFEEGKCPERSANTMTLRYVAPKTTTTTTTTTEPPKTSKAKKVNTTENQDT